MKILLTKTSSLGDIIHTFPTLSFLRQKFPEAQIDWVVEKPFAELVKAHPYVNNVLTVDTKGWRKNLISKETWKAVQEARQALQRHSYDLVFDLQGNSKSGLITLQVDAPIKIGFKNPPEWPNKWFTNKKYDPPPGRNIRLDYLYLAQSYLLELSPFNDPGVRLRLTESQQKVLDSVKLPQGPLVMVCPGSAWLNKQLSEEALGQFLKRVQSHLNCTFLLVWGNQEEQALVERLSLALRAQVIDRLPLPALQNLMARMQLVIAMDSLPLHLAGTTSVPTFSVFGSSLAAKYRPEGEQHRSYKGPCPYGRTFDKRCPILRTCKTGSCIRGVSGDVLFDQFLSR